jgi:4-amino-4-deoxy-L-arabinose transferase-like glycosyltransferase
MPGWMAAGLLLLTGIRLIVAGMTALSPDEAYYWVWSRALAPGYLDHPPMVALWIRAGTTVGGTGVLGVRALAPLAALLGSVLLAEAAEDLLPGRRAGPVAAALLNATLLLGVGAVIMTPDTPLLFFWTVAIWTLGRLLRSGNGRWWLATGLAVGAALDSKYTGFLLAGGIVLWLLLVPAMRVWLRRWESWAGGALALACFAPVLWWNAAHGWASFVKQGGRTGVWHPVDALRFLGELVAGQVGLATPIVFVLCVAGVVLAVRRLRDPAWGLLAALTVPGAAVFIEHAFGDRVQANWPAILYPAAAIAAAGLGIGWRRWWRPAVALGLVVCALVYVQAVAAPIRLPARLDVALARLQGWPSFAVAVDGARLQAGAGFVAADNYGIAAELARDLPPGVDVVGAEPRWADFDLPPATSLGHEPGLLVRSGDRQEAPPVGTAPGDWASATLVGEMRRGRPGATTQVFRLYSVTLPAGRDADMVLLPRPQG